MSKREATEYIAYSNDEDPSTTMVDAVGNAIDSIWDRYDSIEASIDDEDSTL